MRNTSVLLTYEYLNHIRTYPPIPKILLSDVMLRRTAFSHPILPPCGPAVIMRPGSLLRIWRNPYILTVGLYVT